MSKKTAKNNVADATVRTKADGGNDVYAFVTVTVDVHVGTKGDVALKNLTPEKVLEALNEYDDVTLGEAFRFGAYESNVEMGSPWFVLTEEIAKQFIKDDTLDLDGLTTLSDAAAEVLAKHEGDLCLDNLTTLSDAVAVALGKHLGSLLSLTGLTSLSDAAAEALAKHEGEVFVSDEIKKIINKYRS